jgi:hypothetical protein
MLLQSTQGKQINNTCSHVPFESSGILANHEYTEQYITDSPNLSLREF